MNTPTPTTFRKVYLASWSTLGPNPHPTPEPDEDSGEKSDGYMLLDTLRTRQDQGRCVPCGSAAHRSQECPLVADRLFAR
jgi:hypothetical protein